MDSRKWNIFLSLQGNDKDTPEPSKDISTPLETIYDRLINYDIFNFFNLPDYKRILIIGAGNGGEIRCFADRGYDVIGTTLHWSDKKFAKNNYGIDLLIQDMHNMSIPSGIFDGVYSYHVLEHSLSPLIVLFEMRKILRYNGKLCAIVPQSGTNNETGIQHYSVLTEKLWRHLLNLIGFGNIQIYSSNDNTMMRAIKTDKDCPGKHFENELRKIGLGD